MGKLDLNFGKVGEVPPNGTYRFRVEKATVKPTKANDSYNINLMTKLTDAPSEIAEDFEDHTVFHTLNTKPGAMIFVQEALEAITQMPWRDDEMGFEIDEEELEEKGVTEIETLKDHTFIGNVVNEPYEGRAQLKIKKFFADDSNAPEIKVANTEE